MVDPQGLTSLDPVIEVAWRKHAQKRQEERETAIHLDLPSGKPVKAIRAPLQWLYRHNLIPDALLAQTEEMIRLIESGDPNAVGRAMEEELQENEEQAFEKWLALLNGCWLACVTSPEFTDDESRREAVDPPYWIGDVDYMDKLFLYGWAQGVDQSIQEFLQFQSEIVGAMADGTGVQLSSEGSVWVDRTGRRMAGVAGGPSGIPIRELHQGPNRSTRRKAGKQVKKETANRTGT